MGGTDVITREAFLASLVVSFPKYEEVSVPGLGMVWVKKLNAGEQDKFETDNSKNEARDFRARLVSHCCINQQGARLFEDADIPTLSQFGAETLDPIVEAAFRINVFTKKEQDALRKNSNGQADSSSAV